MRSLNCLTAKVKVPNTNLASHHVTSQPARVSVALTVAPMVDPAGPKNAEGDVTVAGTGLVSTTIGDRVGPSVPGYSFRASANRA